MADLSWIDVWMAFDACMVQYYLE